MCRILLNLILALLLLSRVEAWPGGAGHCVEGSPASTTQGYHPTGSESLVGGDYIVKIGDQELGNFEGGTGSINLNVGESYTVTVTATGSSFKGLNFRMPKANIFTITDSNFKLNDNCNAATSAVTHGSGADKTSTSFSMQVSEAGAVRLDVTIMQVQSFWYWSYFNLNFVEPSPTTSPTASPTSAPTKSPTASPSQSPSVAPSALPSAIPSALPSSNPVGTAQLTDATTLFQKKKKNGSIAYKGCDWVSGNADKFEKRCGNEKHASHCPKTCQKEEYRCSDSLHTFQFTKANGKQKDKTCSFLLNKPDKLSNRCQKEIFKTTCRATCLSANSVDGC